MCSVGFSEGGLWETKLVLGFKGESVCQCVALTRTLTYKCLQYVSKWVTCMRMCASIFSVCVCVCILCILRQRCSHIISHILWLQPGRRIRGMELSREQISHYPNNDLATQWLGDFPFNKNWWCELHRGRGDEILLWSQMVKREK